MRKRQDWFQRCYICCYRWLTGLLYHQFAWAYDVVAWFVSWGQWSKWRQDALAYVPDGDVFEVGFGTGALLIGMAKRGQFVVGLEASQQMQWVTGWKLQREHLSVNRVQGYTEAMPFPHSSFNGIVATFPANYIAEETSLREFYRVLKDEGTVVVVGINVQFSSPFKAWVSNWLLGSEDQRMVQYLVEKANAVGFTEEILEYHHKDSSQTVMILIRDTHE